MEMDFSQLFQTIIDSATLIITALVALGVVYIKNYASKRISNDELKNSVLLTLTTVENSVKSTVQNMSENAKIAVADGKVSKEEFEEIRKKAFNHFSKQVSPELQKRLQAHVGDVELFITDKVAAELQKVEKVTG